jgi:hypothetical protein
MKKLAFLLVGVVCVAALFAQTELYIYKTDKTVLGIPVSKIDSILFSKASIMKVFKTDKTTTDLVLSTIDSISVGEVVSDTVTITYAGTTATVDNPMAKYGVSVVANGANVVVNSTVTDNKINYLLKGSSTNGSFKIYSTYRIDLILNGVSLTNSDGPAINIQTKKRCEITMDAGTTNTLTDGTSYASSSEDQKGTFFSEGQLIFKGPGTLTVNGNAKNGIVADDFIEVNGGTMNLNVTPASAKGLKCSGTLSLNGGAMTVNMTGSATLSATGLGYDPSYCTAIKCDSTIKIAGSAITITCSGVGGKGISSDQDVLMIGGTVNVTTTGNGATYINSLGKTDGYTATCLEADRNINILGGSVTTSSTGIGGKGISADGNLTFGDATNSPTINVTTTGTRLLVSGTTNYTTAVYATPKAIKSDGVMNIVNGTFTVSTAQSGGDAIDCDSVMTVSGGTLGITLKGAGTKGLKSSRDMNLNGGSITITASGATVLENVAAATYNPSHCTGVKSDAAINLNGTNITLTGSGTGSKGISSGATLTMNAGTVNLTCSGAGATYKNSTNVTDSYCSSCFSSDGAMLILGGKLTTATGAAATGGKGISSNAAITIGSATTTPILSITTTGARFLVSGTDYCHPKTLVSPLSITINSGTNTFTSTDDGIHSDLSVTINGGNKTVTAYSTIQGVWEGVEGPTITFNGGTTNIVASNDGINGTYGTVVGGTESNDNSNIYFKGGLVIVAGSDAVDGNGNITMTGGTVIVNGPTSQPEEGLDFNGALIINGGLLISAGSNTNMTQAMSASSTQPGMFIKSSAVLASTSIFHIENASGTDIITFKPKNNAYYFHFSSASLTKGAQYKIYFGGSYSGGSFIGGTSGNGLYTGGTYSSTGATLKSTSTLSTTSTSNTISF